MSTEEKIGMQILDLSKTISNLRQENKELSKINLSNAILIEKLEERNKELVEMLEVAKQKLHRCNDPGTSTSILANEITELLNKLK